MAPRSKSTPRKPPTVVETKETAVVFDVASLVKAVLLLVLAGSSSAVSQLSLSPVYGSIPSAIFHQRAVTGTALLAVMARQTLKDRIPKSVEKLVPVVAYWIPALQFVLFQYSAHLGPVYGPLVTEGLTYLPLLLMTVYSAAGLLESLDLVTGLNSTLAEMIIPVTSYTIVSMSGKAAAGQLPSAISSYGFITRSGLQFLIASIYAAASMSLWLILAVPAIIHTIFFNPHYHGEHTTALANTTLEAYNFTLLERRESLTGYVSVLEDRNNWFRVMRCDHSLLGGNWLVTQERRAQGITIPETIYSVFTMLEAVRLVETYNDKPDSAKNALVIGLGIGTAPSALISHGINTTIVELDPAVHDFAVKYFALPSNHTAAITDAVTFVEETSKTSPSHYDYIIHDVFTGGAEPVTLFTVDFFQGLKSLLRKNGVVAINYAGDMALPSTQMVLNTIHHVFTNCRLFRDTLAQDLEPGGTDFINMIVFCTTAPEGTALSFRMPTDADFLGSIARRNFLYPRPEHEIKYDFKAAEPTAKMLRRGETQELEKHQNEGAVSHWRIMRSVLPSAVWENW